MCIAACRPSPRWAWPTRHAPLGSASCLPLLSPSCISPFMGWAIQPPCRHANASVSCPSASNQSSPANVFFKKIFLISCLPSPFHCTCPSLGFHPLSPGPVTETSSRFIGMQLFLLVPPMPLPVTSPSSCCLATLTHPLRLSSGILSRTLSSPHTHPQEFFSFCFLSNSVPQCRYL